MNQLFELDHWRVMSSDDGTNRIECNANMKIRVEGKEILVAATGVGPVDALYNALCKALKNFYPAIDELALVDYIVHIENSNKGITAEVNVIVEMRRGEKSYIAKSRSTNILVASWDALVEALTTLLSD